jgi:hypothetical protein
MRGRAEALLRFMLVLALVSMTGGHSRALQARRVYPGGRIQDALDAAAADPVNKTVYVHAGTYRPAAKGQALIWFNARHDGITLEAVGEVILTAANPDIADRQAPSYPAVVNHVVYFGDGIARRTVLRGFRITGANNFTTARAKHHRSSRTRSGRRRSSSPTAAASPFRVHEILRVERLLPTPGRPT